MLLKKILNPVLVPFLLLCALGACKTDGLSEDAVSVERFSAFTGIKISNIDPLVRPQDDFYRYANGLWLSSFELPPDRPSFGVFNQLADELEVSLRSTLAKILQSPDHLLTDEEKKVRAFYIAYMDLETIQRKGLIPLEPFLHEIGEIGNQGDIVSWIGTLSSYQMTQPFRVFADEHPFQAEGFVLHLEQAGLGIPGREFYLENDSHTVEVRTAYITYAETLFRAAGMNQPGEKAQNLLEVETLLAEFIWPLEETRIRERIFNVYTLDDLEALTPGFDWGIFLSSFGHPYSGDIIIHQPDYLAALARLIGEIDPSKWRDYFYFHLLNDFARFLPPAFHDARFSFYQGTLKDVVIQTPREREVFNLLSDVFSPVFGRAYIEKEFNTQAIPLVENMIANLKEAFAKGLEANSWMSARTKKKALEKLDKLSFKIAYPEKWPSLARYETSSDDLVGNILAFQAFDLTREMGKITNGREEGTWETSPLTVNAFYTSATNEIVLPAAILQPPLLNIHADSAANYGALGAIIAHEIVHAFDDQGRKFDGEGRFQDWWTEKDARAFGTRAERLVEYYNNLEPMEGLAINGRQTLGENIGDLQGLSLAYDAYRISMRGREAPVLANFTGPERFFLSWAQLWVKKYQEAELRRILRTSLHSPAKYRVNGVVSHIDGFYDTFEVRPGDVLYLPEKDRIRFW